MDFTEPYQEATIDLTKADDEEVKNNEPSASLAIALALPTPYVTEGITLKNQKRKSGEVKPPGVINWLDHNHQIKLKATRLLNSFNTGRTSGEMMDQQMELATELAKFEDVLEELQVEKAELGANSVSRIPQPAGWVNNPGRPPICEMKTGMKIQAYSENDHFAKITKLTTCMKYMNIEVNSQTLKAWYMRALQAEAEALGVQVRDAPSVAYRAVAISRTMPRDLFTDEGKLHTRENSLRFLYILPAHEVVQHLKDASLALHLAARKHILGGQVTVLVLDCDKYFRKGKPQADLQVAIIDVMVTLEIDVILMKDADELISTILQFTKAVAEEPAKLAKRDIDEQAEFYMRGDNKNCVTVDQEGNGLTRLWQQMLTVLPQSSLEIARAISAAYSSPRALTEALRGAGGEARLAALPVRRSAAPGARSRRLGAEMARRLRVLFTEEDGDVLVE